MVTTSHFDAMTAEITDLQQRLANLFRVGKVAEIDHDNAMIRVSFGRDAVNRSGWIPWMTARAGATREWNPPTVGEQVCIIQPGGIDNTGFALPGGIYRNDYSANGTTAGHVELDLPEAGKWIVRVGDVVITAADGTTKIQVGGATLELTGSKMTWNRDVEIVGNVEVTGGITTTDDVVADGVSLITHIHGGVDPGGGTTSAPI